MDDAERLNELLERFRADTLSFGKACRAALPACQRLVLLFSASAVEAADLGEFDNRAHDWIGSDS